MGIYEEVKALEIKLKEKESRLLEITFEIEQAKYEKNIANGKRQARIDYLNEKKANLESSQDTRTKINNKVKEKIQNYDMSVNSSNTSLLCTEMKDIKSIHESNNNMNNVDNNLLDINENDNDELNDNEITIINSPFILNNNNNNDNRQAPMKKLNQMNNNNNIEKDEFEVVNDGKDNKHFIIGNDSEHLGGGESFN